MTRNNKNQDPSSQGLTLSLGGEHQSVIRLPFAPTPLNPNELSIVHGGSEKGFASYSQEAVSLVLVNNFDSLEHKPTAELETAMLVLINGALFRRLESNSHKVIPPDCDEESAELFSRACMGTADQVELLRLLELQPCLGSIELAKLTTPFVWDATGEMDEAVHLALEAEEYELLEGSSRYYYMNADNGSRALTIVRKKNVGKKGDIDVIRKDTFVIDLDQEPRIARSLKLWQGSPNAKERITGGKSIKLFDGEPLEESLRVAVEAQIKTSPHERSASIFPGSRSYFACVVRS